MPFGVNKETGLPGPTPKPSRDGDRLQARKRVNSNVRSGKLPKPNDVPCNGCGHIHSKPGDRRHEYHHHLGYAAEHHLSVISLCAVCHKKETFGKVCRSGRHKLTGDNRGIRANGRAFCRECRRERDRKRPDRDADYWRRYRAKIKEKQNEQHKN